MNAVSSSTKVGFAQWLVDNKFDDPEHSYNYFFDSICSAASVVGINLLINDINPNFSRKYSNNGNRFCFKTVKGTPEGSVVAFVNIQEKEFGKGDSRIVVKFPYFRFYTNKGGGFYESFSVYSAVWDLYKSNTSIDDYVKPKFVQINPKKAAADDLKLALWSESQIELWGDDYANGSDYLAGSLYLKAKFADLVSDAAVVATAAGVKHGHDKKGDFLILRMSHKNGKVAGYQKIYDVAIDDTGRNKDYRFLPDAKKGSFIRLGVANKLDDYVFVTEGFATGLSVYLATGKAVFVAGDAQNLAPVLQAVQAMGFKRPVIAADNDTGGKGNTGLFAALKAAKAHTARIFVADLDGVKADFNDVMLAKGLPELKKQLVFRKNPFEIVPERNAFDGAVQLLKLCQLNVIKKHIWFCCATAVSNQFLLGLDDAAAQVSDVLAQRGVDVDVAQVDSVMKKALFYALKRCKAKNKASFAGFNAVIDTTGRNNASIAVDILANKGIWLDDRPMGTGKTELMGAVLALAIQRGLFASYICHRQSLVANSSERIRAVSYKNIANRKEMEGEDTVAVCINSIINPRFSSHVTQFSNVIFIDEIRQTLEHVAIGSISSSERKAVYDALILAIKTADYVLGSDADLNQLTVDWLKHNFPDKAFYGLSCAAVNPEPVIEYGHYVPAFNAAVKSALSGVPTLIQSDSIKASKAIFQAVNRPHLKVLLVNSENKADENQAKFLRNPNNEIVNYDVVIHSPVIGSGVSITCDHIKAHYALFRGVLAENEVLQMIGRNRNSAKIVCGFNDKHTKNRCNSAKTLLDGEVIARARVVDGEPIIEAIDRLRMKIISRHNDSLNDIAVQSLLLMRLKGYEMRRFEGDESNETLSIARKSARAVHCEGVLSATDISAMDAYKLEKAESVTQEDSYKLEKYSVQYEFGLPSTNEGKNTMTEDDVVFFDSGRAVKTIHNREIAEAELWQREAIDDKSKGFKSVAKGFHIDVLMMMLTDRTVDQYHAVVVCEYLQKNHAEIAALGLGNYAKLSKYPVRAVNQFLEHFGYALVGHKLSKGVRKGDRVYTLKTNERIDVIVRRRTIQNLYKSVCEKVADAA